MIEIPAHPIDQHLARLGARDQQHPAPSAGLLEGEPHPAAIHVADSDHFARILPDLQIVVALDLVALACRIPDGVPAHQVGELLLAIAAIAFEPARGALAAQQLLDPLLEHVG